MSAFWSGHVGVLEGIAVRVVCVFPQIAKLLGFLLQV